MNFQKIEFELAAGKEDQLPESSFPEIVFCGKSNVGKSSLINKLANRKALARVSATPGKVSRAEKERWANLVEGYFAQQRKIALVIQLLDMRHEPTQDDISMINFLLETGHPFVVVCTKSDKLNKTQSTAQKALFTEVFQEAEINFYPFSAVSGVGLEQVKELIEQAVVQNG